MDNRRIIQRSLDYIEDNLQAEISARELAEQAVFSLFHYYRLFQLATGLPVMQYIQRRRLLHGVYAMKQGLRKTDAALAFGFDTYAGFYKAFCREFGDTPSAFLESSRAKQPYRIDITREEQMTITHKYAARILRNWNLSDAPIADIYQEGTGNKNDNALSVGSEYILKYTANPGNIIRSGDRWGFIDFELAERNARIYDPCYAATAVLSETFGQGKERWLEIYRDIIQGYDSVVHLTDAERRAIPYILLANQFVCVAWFAEQDKYAELLEINKCMTVWLLERFAELKEI